MGYRKETLLITYYKKTEISRDLFSTLKEAISECNYRKSKLNQHEKIFIQFIIKSK